MRACRRRVEDRCRNCLVCLSNPSMPSVVIAKPSWRAPANPSDAAIMPAMIVGRSDFAALEFVHEVGADVARADNRRGDWFHEVFLCEAHRNRAETVVGGLHEIAGDDINGSA